MIRAGIIAIPSIISTGLLMVLSLRIMFYQDNPDRYNQQKGNAAQSI